MAQREVWDMKAREHDNQQPLIAERVIQSLQTNASKSYGAVSLDIGEWCSASTIQVWLASFKSCSIYVEQVLPLLLIVQREKHVTFSKLLRSNWNLPKAKYLWIHYDEKWFYGFVTRSNAKKCPELGRNFGFSRHGVCALVECWFTIERRKLLRDWDGSGWKKAPWARGRKWSRVCPFTGKDFLEKTCTY
jgi:hypothetical protein